MEYFWWFLGIYILMVIGLFIAGRMAPSGYEDEQGFHREEPTKTEAIAGTGEVMTYGAGLGRSFGKERTSGP